MWYVITHTSLNFNAVIVKQPAKLGFVRVITSHKITDAVNYLCHDCSRAILCKMAQVFLKLNFQNRIRNRFFLLKIKVLRYSEDRLKQIMYTYHFKVFWWTIPLINQSILVTLHLWWSSLHCAASMKPELHTRLIAFCWFQWRDRKEVSSGDISFVLCTYHIII